ncbi:4'-phosphopantetheinyl transferase superfamily protein [Streptomyces sp. NBC_01410]|uniref:4'-phosphopantetheinyl transferase family protein n=1 Tax=Streptomyces sp. NBC_01410 TaxID=2903856 RepID=UPI00324F5CC6
MGLPAPQLLGPHTGTRIPFPSHTVDLWAAEVGDCDPAGLRYAADGLLPASELCRSAGIHAEPARLEFLLGRMLLRSCLTRYFGGAPATWPLRMGADGKPGLAGLGGSGMPRVSFNLSHSEGLCLLGFTGGPSLGVDIEQLRPVDDEESLSAVLLTRAERRSLAQQPHESRTRQFFERWVLKEAYAKALGTGISTQFGGAGFIVGPGAPPRLEPGPATPRDAESWVFRLLDLHPGFVAAVAVPRPGHGPAVSFALRRVTPFRAVRLKPLTDRDGDGMLRAGPRSSHPPLARRGPT